MAEHIFDEVEDEGMIDSTLLWTLILKYKDWYKQGLDTNVKSFLYDQDPQISQLVVSIMDFKYELSPNWSERYEGKIADRESLYREETESTINYLKLRKIKRLIEENQKDLETTQQAEDQILLLQTHQHLKQLERELTHQLGTVILK